jgi:type IV secretion system protein VirB10
MPTGTIIHAVLETPIDTSRTGFVRAIVSQDARGFDGRRVLVPRGSRLIGEFRADIRPGAKRVLVNWNRLVRPDGVVIQLDSPAADPLGGPGIPATVHGPSLGRIIGSAFQSALYFGSSVLGGRLGTTVVIASPTGSAGAGVAQVFTPGMEQAPRLTVREGTLVNVFVAHDLDFSSGPSGRQQ